MTSILAVRDVLLWLDDKRYPPSNKWTWVKTAQEAIDLLKTKTVLFASLDHDLEPEHYEGHPNYDRVKAMRTTGYAVVLWLEREAYRGNEDYLPPDGVRVHSMNPHGAGRMVQAIAGSYDIGNSLAFQCETKHEVLPWQLYGQPNGWWSKATTQSMIERYRGCSHC